MSEAEITEAGKVAAGKSPPVLYVLVEPIDFGGETITELKIRPSAKAFRGFALKLTADGGMLFEPYVLAALGVKMAGEHPQILDLMGITDMQEVAIRVLNFFVPGLKTGSTPSQ